MEGAGDATASWANDAGPSGDSPPVKYPHLLSHYKAHKRHSSNQDSSPVTQINNRSNTTKLSRTQILIMHLTSGLNTRNFHSSTCWP